MKTGRKSSFCNARTLCCIGLLCSGLGIANAQLAWGPFSATGYGELYYVHDFADFPTVNRMVTPSGVSPIYSYNRADEPAINDALLDLKFATNWVRAAAGFQGGTYEQQNYAGEQGFAKYIYEASAGVQPVENLWLDAGVFPSHIGLESSVSKDNANLTRSLMADNTPYYESGAKATWEPDKRWLFSALALRGWQSIDDPNHDWDGGTQIQFKPNDAWLFNSSTFIGEYGADRHERYFHDFYVTWQATTNFSLSGSLDLGLEEHSATDRNLSGWVSGMVVARYQFDEHWAAAARVEHYHDPNGLTIATATAGNFVATGGSVNVDYQPEKHVMLRTEFRNITAEHAVFIHQQGLAHSDNSITTSLILMF